MTDLNVDNDGARREPPPVIDDGESRADLEALRATLIDRLHRRSDDFDATRELRLVYTKLQGISYGKQTVTTSS